MIETVVETENRWLLEVGNDGNLPCGAVEIVVLTQAITGKTHIVVNVSLDDPDVVVDCTVKPS